MKRHDRIYRVIIVLSIAAVLYMFLSNNGEDSSRNAYAMTDTATLVIMYLQTNNDEWPGSWSDLESQYQQFSTEKKEFMDFDEIKDRVIVNWNADVQSIKQSSTPAKNLVALRNGDQIDWNGGEPNERIHDYLEGTD